MYLINFKNVPLTILNLYLLRTIINDSFPNPGTSGEILLERGRVIWIIFWIRKVILKLEGENLLEMGNGLKEN